MGDRGEGALNFHKGKVRSNFSLVSQVCCQKELGLEKYTAVHGHARRPRPRPHGPTVRMQVCKVCPQVCVAAKAGETLEKAAKTAQKQCAAPGRMLWPEVAAGEPVIEC